ncbi:MAG: RagB/SusD family nutrient uptake outer membrane protein [Lentimicrobiaceae bacterium]|nr:RagB/SusD family nutrient uptake outer membrane protein [Lentimicrobiaceae bacterium]
MKKSINIFLLIAAGIFVFTSCVKDLDTVPLDKDEITAASVYEDTASYKLVLAKLYAGLAVSGQTGPHGAGDISGIDEGFGQYLRGYWYHQELTTDEAVMSWSDQTIKDLHWQTWGTSDVFIAAMYYRIFYQISICNEYIRETSDSKLSERGISSDLRTMVGYYRAEARFLRALSYWHALDLFGNVPFVTEDDQVGSFFPSQIQRADLYQYIESELLAIENLMVEPRQNEYGRTDKAAVWMLLAKLYLNAEVYTGQPKYTECITYCKNIINAGYTLEPEYSHLFLADNAYLNEVIFAVPFDGTYTRTWGGTTFIICAAVGGTMNPTDFGVEGGWGGTRTTKAFVQKFTDITGQTDKRAMFYTDEQSLEIEDVGFFNQGYAITKFKNVKRDGAPGSNLTYTDTDFPMFRLADTYLMYAEAVLRGGSGGDKGTAIGYVNELRERAYGNLTGNVNDIDLDFILDERARELYWECHRRTDLIRYGLFTGGDYLWPWKGKIMEGMATDSKYNLFPIPSSDLMANLNLKQNPDY